MSLQLIANQNPQSALFKQVTAKIKILQKTNQYIDGALKTIASSNGNVTKIDAPRILNELFSPHHPPIEEINEMGAFGIVQLFKVEVVERQVNPLEVLFVGILAFAQVVIGTICVHTGMVSFGVNMISNGIQDMIKASELASGNLSIKNYFVGKGIELAVFALTVGIEKVASLATSTSRNAANQAAGQMTQSTADAIVKNALLTTAVGIGVDYAISGACEVASKIFEDDVQDAVHRQVHTAFEKSHLRQDLAYIWLVDGFTSTNRGERAIEEAISDTLMSKRSLAATMAEQTLTAMSHSTSASIKAIGYAARIAKASCDITKITEFTEDFCESFAGKVGYIKSRLPTIGDLMYKDMRLVNRNDAPKIMEILEQHSVMIHGHIQPDYAQKLSGVELDDAVHVRLSAFVNKLAAAGSYDTNSRLNRLEESITECLTSRVLGQIHTQITTPLAREGTRQTDLIDRISDKIEEGAAQLRDAFNKSRIENGARIVDLNTISNNAKAAWVNPDDAGIGGGSDKNGKAAGDTPNGQEEVEGLPWLKKEQASAKNPPPVAPKPKHPTLSQKAAEDAAGQRVIDEINNQQELLGQPVTIPDNPLLKLNLNPQPVEQEQNAESSGPKTLSDVGNNLFKDFLAPDKMGTSEFMNPLKMSWSAVGEIKQYIEENAIYGIMKIPGGRYTLEKVSAVMQPVSTVLHAGAEGAAKLVLTEQEISVLKQKFNEQPNGIQILGRDILEILLFGGATKVASTTFKTGATITKPLAKAGLDSLKSAGNKASVVINELGDSLLPPLNPAFAGLGAGFESAEKSTLKSTVFTSEVMEPTPASVVKKIETTASASANAEVTTLGTKKKVSDLAKKFQQPNLVKETTSAPPSIAHKPKNSLIKKFEEQQAAEIYPTESYHNKPITSQDSIGLPDAHLQDMIKEMTGNAVPYSGSIADLAAVELQIARKAQGSIIAGVGHKDPIHDINRIINQYGGEVTDWAKMSSKELNTKKFFHEGKSIQFHWYENIKTGLKIEHKLKIQKKYD